MILNSFLAVLLLALTHLLVNRLNLSGIPRSKWLSVAGGISVTYIFLEAFPELMEIQQHINNQNIFALPAIARVEVFLVSLLGLAFFYALENRSKKSANSNRDPDKGGEKNYNIFWIHISSFSVYNFIIAYLLLNREEESLQSFLLYAVAMSFHLLVTDHSMDDHFQHLYRKKGRWILILALVMGWVLSLFVHISEVYVGIIFAFIAGGVIMNVLKEELPRERESNLSAFCMGILVYGSILILT